MKVLLRKWLGKPGGGVYAHLKLAQYGIVADYEKTSEALWGEVTSVAVEQLLRVFQLPLNRSLVVSLKTNSLIPA